MTQVGDPVILVFTNGARGFLALPRPLLGSECDDNNAAGMHKFVCNQCWFIQLIMEVYIKQTSRSKSFVYQGKPLQHT